MRKGAVTIVLATDAGSPQQRGNQPGRGGGMKGIWQTMSVCQQTRCLAGPGEGRGVVKGSAHVLAP